MDESTKPAAQLEERRFQLAEQARNTWAITVEGGEHRPSKDEILSGAFLAHVATRLRPYDRIEVRCDDDSFFAELLVLSTGHAVARTAVLSWTALTAIDDAAADEISGYKIEKKGPHKQWCVIRESDKAYIHEGAVSREAARFWLVEHLKTFRKAA